MLARQRRQQKSERRRLREAREASGASDLKGKAALETERTAARNHPVPFLYPIPLYYVPVGGCVVGVGGVVDGGGWGATCASVRRWFMSLLLGYSLALTVVSRVLGEPAALELLGVGVEAAEAVSGVVAEVEGDAEVGEDAAEVGDAEEDDQTLDMLAVRISLRRPICTNNNHHCSPELERNIQLIITIRSLCGDLESEYGSTVCMSMSILVCHANPNPIQGM